MMYLKLKIVLSLQLLRLAWCENSNFVVTCEKDKFFQSDGNCSTNITLYFPKADVDTLNFYLDLKSLHNVTRLCDCAMMWKHLSCIGADYEIQVENGVFTAYNLKCSEGEFYIRYNQDRDIKCTSLKDSNTTTTFVTTFNGVGSNITGLSTEATIGLAAGIPTFVVAVLLIIFVWKRCKKRNNQEGNPSGGELRQLEQTQFLTPQNTLTHVDD